MDDLESLSLLLSATKSNKIMSFNKNPCGRGNSIDCTLKALLGKHSMITKQWDFTDKASYNCHNLALALFDFFLFDDIWGLPGSLTSNYQFKRAKGISKHNIVHH